MESSHVNSYSTSTIWGTGRKRTAAVIPAFNEEKTIASVVIKAKAHVDEVLVVDDGSADETALMAEKAGATVLKMPGNSGKAEALLSGLDMIANDGFDAAVLLDGDMQHDPRQIPDLLAPILAGKADLVIGSRFLNSGKGIPRYRKAGQIVLNKATSFGAKVKVTDSQSGFRALSRKAMRNLEFESEGYNIETDMIAHFAEKQMSITEVPISIEYNVPNGHKKSPIPHGLGVLSSTIGHIGYRRPMTLFGIPGFIAILAGGLLSLLTSMNIYLLGLSWFSQTVATVVCISVGFYLIIGGLTLNSLAALIKSSKGKF